MCVFFTEFSNKVSNQIYTSRRQAKAVCSFVNAFLLISILFVHYLAFFTNWTGTVRDYVLIGFILFFFVFLAFGIPFYPLFNFLNLISLFLLKLALSCIFSYFVLCTKYLSIIQAHQVAGLQAINLRLSCIRARKHTKIVNFQARSVKYWRQFRKINRNFMRFTLTIMAYSRFWGKYLTILFCGHIIEVCYLFHISMTWQRETGQSLKLFMMLLASRNFAYLNVIIWDCSKLVKHNLGIHHEIVRFYLNYHSLLGKLTLGDLLKVNRYIFVMDVTVLNVVLLLV